MDHFVLNNGLKIPVFGSGTNTFGKERSDFKAAVTNDFTPLRTALEAGYTLFDTAMSYGNEAGIGSTLAELKADRSSLYIITKMTPNEETLKSPETVRHCVEESLRKLQTDYIDLYLIHRPIEDDAVLAMVWATLEECVKEGKLRSIGVSNFLPSDLERLMKTAVIPPAANEICINSRNWNDETVDYCLAKNILPIGWGPMSVADEVKEILSAIGEGYCKTWAQVILRYHLQRGILSIPKSHNAQRQKQNLDIFDFALTDEEMDTITKARK